MNPILRRARDDRGFTLAPMMAGLLVVLLLTAATAAAIDGDLRPGLGDRDRKQALAAAEAGVHDYLARLKINPNLWSLCTTPTGVPLNDPRPPAGRRWSEPLPGTTARFSLELIPVGTDGQGVSRPRCDPSNPQASMIDPNGAFRLRSTGEARPGGPRRTVVATFRPAGFLNFIYYTDYETGDPRWYEVDAWGADTKGRAQDSTANPLQSLPEWGYANCVRYAHSTPSRRSRYWVGRGWDAASFDASWTDRGEGILGLYYDRNTGRIESDDLDRRGTWSATCDEIQFAPGDRVLGPLHTNDTINVCGSPQFGERSTDVIEVNGPGDTGEGWRATCSGATPNKVGRWVPNAGTLLMPASNTALKNDAPARLRFVGKTQVRFDGDRILVTGRREDGTTVANTPVTVNDGDVIYVSDDPSRLCGQEYKPLQLAAAPDGQTYQEPAGCGNVYVQGTYARSLTVGAQGDVVVREDVKRANDGVVLGLISNNWVRVWHPSDAIRDGADSRQIGCRTASANQIGDVQIDAAIMSVNHSFTVDGYFCGPNRLGTLTVRGAIAQRFRGPVGTSGGAGSGYIKDYQYDRRLRYRSPPRFLDPVTPNWTIRSMSEQVPAEQG